MPTPKMMIFYFWMPFEEDLYTVSLECFYNIGRCVFWLKSDQHVDVIRHHFHRFYADIRQFRLLQQDLFHHPKDAKIITDGNVYLTDKRHIRLPKLGSVRFKGSERI